MNHITEERNRSFWDLAAAGDPEAEEALISEYSWLVRSCARPYFLIGGDTEDLIQEGMLGLLSAVRMFDPARNVPFKTYAETCIRKRLYSAIKSATRIKHIPLNDYESLESPQFDENNTHRAYFLRDPEEFVIARERVDEITECLYGALSRFESKILALYLEGLSYSEIASTVNAPYKSVDNAVQRIRKKMAQIIKDGDNQ